MVERQRLLAVRVKELEAALAACADQAGDESYAAVCLERDEARKEVASLEAERDALRKALLMIRDFPVEYVKLAPQFAEATLEGKEAWIDGDGCYTVMTRAAVGGEGRRSLLVTARESVGLPPARTPEERTGGE